MKLYYKWIDQPQILKYDAAMSRAVFEKVNAYRVSQGLNALQWDNALCLKIAKINAGYNVSHHVYGTGIEDLPYHIPSCIGHGGEGTISADSAFNGWKNSPLHNSNMLNPNDVSGAVAVMTYNDKYGHQWSTCILSVDPFSPADNALMTAAEIDEYLSLIFIEEGYMNIPKNEWSTYINTASIS